MTKSLDRLRALWTLIESQYEAILDIHLLFETEAQDKVVLHGLVSVFYPINALRNLSLRNAMSKWVFLVDSDFVPSLHMHERVLSQYDFYLQPMAKGGLNDYRRTALVIATWEVLTTTNISEFTLPRTKRDLIALEKRAMGVCVCVCGVILSYIRRYTVDIMYYCYSVHT